MKDIYYDTDKETYDNMVDDDPVAVEDDPVITH